MSFRNTIKKVTKSKTTNDIEFGLAPAPTPAPVPDLAPTSSLQDDGAGHDSSSTRFAKSSFLKMLDKIQEKSHLHVDSEKRGVYRILMNHLDEVEETYRPFRYTLIAIEFVVFSILLTALVCTLKLERMNHSRFLHLRMWQYVTMVMMIVSGLSVVRFITFLLSWPVLWWWRISKYVVYFIRQLKRCLDVTLWFCIVLFGWYAWFRPRLRDVHGDISVVIAHQITRFLFALCLGSFLWLLKNILYLKLEADLHYDQLFERIRLSVIYLHGLQIIHNRGLWRFLPDNKTKKKLLKVVIEKTKPDPKDEIFIQGNNIWMYVMAMEKESVPIWILRRLAEEYIDQVKLRPLPGNSDITKDDQKIIKEAKKMFKQLVNNRFMNEKPKPEKFSDLEIKREDLDSSYELTKFELDYIFDRLKKQEEEHEDDDDEAQESSTTTTQSEERTISYDEFLNWAVRAYKNCWGLERTLESSKRVFIKLNRLMSAFLVTVVVIIWLLLSGIINTGQLALLFTPFLAASFVFGESCKKMFEGLIFAFAMHPFDVGDRVIINNVQMRVTELNILTSAFHKYDTGEEVITPNSTLTTTSIINLDITPDQGDKLEFVLCAQTPLEDVKDLEIKIKKYLDDDIEYSSNNKVVKSEIGKEEMKMIVYFKYLVSYLTAESKAVHKSKILSKIMELRNEMDQGKSKSGSSSYDLYNVDISLAPKAKLKDIEDLEEAILSGLEVKYSSCSKVVITELTRTKLKIGLYVYSPDDPVEKKPEKEEDSENGIHHMWKTNANAERIKKNLEDVSERLKRNKFVEKVRFCQVKNGKVEVIAQGGIGWESFQASDVIQNQGEIDHSITPLEKIRSGGVHANLMVMQEVEQAVLEHAQSQSQDTTEHKDL